MLMLLLDGTPISKARPRLGRGRKAYDPQHSKKKSAKWEIISQYREDPLDGPLKVSLEFSFPIPKSTPKYKHREMLQGTVYHTKKPDVDNCAKWVLDILNDIVYEDDRQVVEISASKHYSNNPQTIITIEKLNPDD